MGRTEALLAWYREHRRNLPWRHTRDPYPILVSEVMLQQTQVSRVVPRYERFLATFPTAAELGSASTEQVLREWSGLGYNRRALNLRATAARVAAEGWPTTVAALQELPGIGPYTAAAIASFAFGVDVAAVDVNLRRVISRWEGVELHGAALRNRAADLVPTGKSADWNQAIMDLGAARCRPRDPLCDACPVTNWCSDPSVETTTTRQGRFVGSNRQARGAVVRELTRSTPQSTDQIAAAAGIEVDRIEAAAAQLIDEGIVTVGSDGLRLGDQRPA